MLLNREYWILIMLASLIALPSGVLLISRWLNSYAYHISIKPAYLLITLLSTITIATATISFHTVKASHLNPAETLKDE